MMTRRYSPPTISAPQPIDMVLHCPKCGVQHIDAPDRTQAKRGDRGWEEWDNPPHRSHLCHGCGHIWRPADVPTNGVAAVKTAGKADSPLSAPPPAQGVQDDSLLRHKLMVLIIRAESRREGTVDVEHVRAALAAPQPAAPQAVNPLDALLTRIINRRVAVEQQLFDMAAGKLPMPDKDKVRELAVYLGDPASQPTAPAPAQAVPPTMPPAYMLAKLQMVIPLFQESRDALTAITEQQRKLHGISPTLAERMDEAGTFSLDDWQSAHGIKQPGSEAC